MTATTSRRARRTTAPEEVAATITVTNSATGQTVGQVPLLDEQGVDDLVTRARAAQPAWAALGAAGRAAVVDRFRRRLAAHRDLVLETLLAESGKPWEDCSADVLLTISWAQQLAAFAPGWLADETLRGSGLFSIGRRNTLVHAPLGVIGVIAPWNVPLSLGIGDALPALLAGNTVVVKPSEATPLSAVLASRLFLESGGPSDVLLVATGDGSTGSALVDRVDHVHFTGSVATGRRVAAQAAANLTPVTLELGGKDAMVVLADADLDRAAAAAVHYALFNTGQVCMGVERVYVHASVHDRFVDLVVAGLARVKQGVPAGPGSVDVSSMIAPAQGEVVRAHVADAVSRGARVVTGGQTTTGPGTFHQPTVLVDVDHSMLCMTEETFGPTIPIMRFTDVDEAVRLVNDCRYGLTASVWTCDLEGGEAIARRLDVGTVTVNDAMFHLGDAVLPMGGWKDSGTGVRNGRQGMLQYTHQKVIQVAHTIGERDPSWLPYDPRTTRVLSSVMGAVLGRPTLPRPSLPSVPGPLDLARTVARRVRR